MNVLVDYIIVHARLLVFLLHHIHDEQRFICKASACYRNQTTCHATNGNI